MSAIQKLMQARLRLQGTKLKKSGENKFAKYSYFELSDFLPTVQEIFAELKLAGFVSFYADKAVLTISDIESDSSIEICSPMAQAQLKGCHDVQNLGAVQTYLRRYLWIAALEIVEHDVLDGGNFDEKKEKTLSADQQTHINDLLQEAGIKDSTPFCNIYNADKVDEIPESRYVNAVNRLKKRIESVKENQTEDVPQ